MELDEYIALQKKTRRQPRHEESVDQIHFVRYVRAKYPDLPIIMSPIFKFSGTPLQRAKQGKRMKSMGYTPGTLDLFFPIKGRCYIGLFIELKTHNGIISPEQEKMIKTLRTNGYCAEVARGYNEAVKIFDWYTFKV